MSIWYHPLHFATLCMVTSFQILQAEALFSNACSSRTDGKCVRCNGVPECFDLSDEADCPNTTLKFIPMQQAAAQTCRKRKCLKDFPKPPPLPPFSLCEQQTTTQKTSALPITTTPAAVVTTPIQVTTTCTNQTTVSEVTYHPTRKTRPDRPTTTRRYKPTGQWPYFTTSPPTLLTTQQLPQTTATINDYLLRLLLRCASRGRGKVCAVCLFLCPGSRNCHTCFNEVSQTHIRIPVQNAPVTVATSLFNLVPTQLFPTFPPTTHPPVFYPYTSGVQDYSNSNEITDDLAYFFWLTRLFNK